MAAVRPYVLERAVLFLLAFDAWVQFVPHGGRYGAGGFNVAHFAWLDAIQPLPSPELHVGLMLIVGGLAWVMACVGGPRWLRALLLVLYTYGWSMSRLDAYQHHYLLSLLLAAFVFFPTLSSADVRDPGRRVSAWAYVLVAANVAIVYAFAAVTKTEAGWASGAVLRSITRSSPWFPALWKWVLATGLREDLLWALLARAVTVMQLLIAFAYLVAVRADASRARWIRVVAWAGLAAAAGFHGSLLLFRIDIRWFSYYMIAIAAAYFLPEAVLRRFVALTTFPVRRLTPARERAGAGWRTVGISMMAACVVAVVGSRLDLPGATAAGFICASVVAVVAVVAVLRGSPEPTRGVATAAAAGALVLAVSVNVLPVRFQYYLYVVADLQRRGDPWGVLAAYERAERYAPRGQSRQPQIEALRSRLATSRSQ